MPNFVLIQPRRSWLMLEFGNFGGFDGLEVKKVSANLGGRQQGRRRRRGLGEPRLGCASRPTRKPEIARRAGQGRAGGGSHASNVVLFGGVLCDHDVFVSPRMKQNCRVIVDLISFRLSCIDCCCSCHVCTA